MDIQLTADQRAFIREGIADGRFQTEADAIRHALALWEEQERRRVEIVAAVDKAEASLAAGRGRTVTTRGESEQLFEEIKQHVATRFHADQNTGR
jgi:putative addiction module CopG family antidote